MSKRLVSLISSFGKIFTAISVISVFSLPAVAHALSPGDVSAWQTSTALPTETFTASGAVFNGYIYNIDGTTNAGDTKSVTYAKLNANGSVGAWTTSGNDLPNTFHRATTVAYNGFLYVVGGYNGVQFDTVYYAQLDTANGSVGAWNTTTTLPVPNQSEAVVVNHGFMYVTGGGNAAAGGNINSVYYAPINANGTLGAWVTSPNTLPQKIRRIGGNVYNNFVYITGGITTSNTQSDTVYYAPLNPDGSVGAWVTSTNVLPTAVWDATSVINNGFIYNIGGNSASGNINNAYYAPLNPDGSVGSWLSATNPLPDSVNGSVGFAYNNFIYNIGGQSTLLGNLSTVYYAALTPKPIVPVTTSSNAAVSQQSPNTGFAKVNNHNDLLPLAATFSIAGIITFCGYKFSTKKYKQ